MVNSRARQEKKTITDHQRRRLTINSIIIKHYSYEKVIKNKINKWEIKD